MTYNIMDRRDFLSSSLKLGAVSATVAATGLVPSLAQAALPQHVRRGKMHYYHKQGTKTLGLFNPHIGEHAKVTYFRDGVYDPEALAKLDEILRDHRQNKVHPIATKLIDALHAVQQELGGQELHIISGYRTPKTNAMLRRRSGQVAKNSYHMHGMAVDIRAPGTATRNIRGAAKSLQVGGVGWYPRSGFVHMDTGPIRYW